MADLEIFRPRQMSLWDRLKRSFHIGGIDLKDPTLARYFGGGGSTLSGVSVNEQTALQVSAVWAAVTMISDDIASLPLMLYKRLPNGGKDRFESHPLYRLLHDSPNPEMDSMVWRRTMQAHALLWQNAYAEIERDQAGRPVAMWPLLPECVDLVRDRGGLRYRVRNPSGNDVFIPAEDMIHLVGYSHDGSVGSSLVSHARESLGLTLAAEKYGAAYFGNGAAMGGVISIDKPRPDERVVKGYREQVEARHMGVDRAHKMMMLYDGAKYTPSTIPPNAGQFNETRIYQIREVARWFKMPPHKLGDLADATYSNVEQMDAAYLSSCLRPWLVLWQQQLSRKLIAPLERRLQFIEHDTHGFLSVDAAGRAALYQAESHIGTVTINEIRGYENRDPLTGGDRVFVDLNRIPLDRYDEWISAEIEAKNAKAEADRRPPPDPVEPVKKENDELKAENERIQRELDLARRATQGAVDAKDLANATLTDVQVLLAQSLEAYEAIDEDRENVAKERDALAAEVTSVRTDLAKLVEVVAALAEERDGLKADVSALVTRADRADGDVVAVQQIAHQNREDAKAEKARAEAAEIERDDLARRLAEAETAAVDLATERDEQIAMVARTALAFGEERAALEAERATLLAETVSLKAERENLAELLSDQEIATIDVAGELDKQLAALDAARADLVKRTADEHSALTERDMLATDVETLEQQLQGAELALETERQQAQAQRAIVRGALLEGFQDATNRLLQRESDRARKAQATPEKLRTWALNFYPMQEDVVRAAFRPFAVAWTAVQGGEPLALLDKLVAQHIETSDAAIRQVADVDDPDTMAPALDRVLRRWETERAVSVADAILREGVSRG